MKTTRREFMKGAGAMGMGLLLGATPNFSQAAPSVPQAAPTLKGKLYGFGMVSGKFPGNEGRALYDTSVLTSFDLETRDIKQTLLEVPKGHAAMGACDGRILCTAHHMPVNMMVDKDHKILATFRSPEKYLYSGHGLVFPDRNLFIFPMRAINPRSKADTGRIEIYDLTTLKKLDMVDTGGLLPHEIHRIPTNQAELAVTHYGTISQSAAPVEFNVIDSKLTILDTQTFKPLRHYDQNNFNAMCTHMRVSNDGWAYIIMTQFILFKDPKDLAAGQTPEQVAREDLERIFNQKWDYPTPKVTFVEKHLPVALPVLRINTQTGERQVIYMGDKYHMHSQSVAHNVATNTSVNLYFESDNLILHTPGKDPEIIPHDQLQLNDIRGVTEIPGTTLIAICGTYHDVSVFDLVTRQVVWHVPSTNYYSTHFYHENDVNA